MLELLFSSQTAVFSGALVLMLAIGAIEAVGLGTAGLDLDAHGLDWLGVGQLPLLVVLVAFLALFGGIGLAGQQIALLAAGHLVPTLIAVPATLVIALPLTAVASRALARIMPRDETTAFDIDDLVGRAGTITVGRATAASPARTRVLDPHGQAHHVLVEPNDPATSFEEGDTVLLVRRDGERFRAILHTSHRYTDWIIP